MKRMVLSLLALLPFLPLLQAADPGQFPVSEFQFKRPAAWKWIEPSGMRKAQLSIPNPEAKGEAAEVVFFHFGPGGGGGAQANVDRWLGQFEEPRSALKSKVEATTVGGRKITYVQAEGTYKSGTPGGPLTPKPGFMLLGAILESPQGDVFIRMTGPAGLVRKAEDEFKKMIESGVKK